MTTKKLALVGAAAALAAAPMAANANSFAQATAPIAGENEIGGDATTRILVLAGVAAAIAILIEVTDSEDDDAPVSV